MPESPGEPDWIKPIRVVFTSEMKVTLHLELLFFSHDYARGIHLDTYIGKRCFIGANAIISCGITVGDEVIIGAGAVVTKDIPSNYIAAGCPARIIRRNIRTRRFGQLIPDETDSEENQPSQQ